MKRLSKFASAALAVGTLGTILATVGGTAGATSTVKATQGAVPSGQHLTVWSWWGGPEAQLMQATANAWGKIHGDTVTVIDKSADSNFNDFENAVRSGAADMAVGIPHNNLGPLQLAGVLAPIPNGLINKSQYIAPAISSVSFAGRMYGIPLAAETYALFYRTNKVKTAPTTWNQFIADAKKVGFEFPDTNFYFAYAYLGGMGGYVFGSNHGYSNAGDIGLNNAGSIAGLNILKDFVFKYHFMSPNFNNNYALSDFQSGKTGFYISGPWDTPGLLKAKVPFAVAPLPLLPNGKHPQTFEGYQTEVVSSRTPNQAAAFSLAQYIAQTTPLKELAVGHRLPVLKSLINGPAVSKNPLDEAFAQALKYGTPMPNIAAMNAVWTPAGNMLTFVTQGKETPQVAANNAVNQIRVGIAIQ
nr:maltose ABC transporter substrate-binding protein [Bacilli bacterium]